MIHSVWKPKFGNINHSKVITHYELTTTQEMIDLKSTGWVVRYFCDKCDSENIQTTKSKVFFDDKVYLNTLDSQTCRSCRSKYSEYKIKKNYIPFEVIKSSIEEYNYKLITDENDYNIANNKSQLKMGIICDNGHSLTTTWNNWSKGKRCRVCYEKNKWENSVKSKEGWELYSFLVWIESEKNYLSYKEIINPKKYRRGSKYHLDHKFSISEGFKYGISPTIIGGVDNLQVIDAKENLKKGTKCSISLDDILKYETNN